MQRETIHRVHRLVLGRLRTFMDCSDSVAITGVSSTEKNGRRRFEAKQNMVVGDKNYLEGLHQGQTLRTISLLYGGRCIFFRRLGPFGPIQVSSAVHFWIQQWKKYENSSTFAELVIEIKVPTFLRHAICQQRLYTFSLRKVEPINRAYSPYSLFDPLQKRTDSGYCLWVCMSFRSITQRTLTNRILFQVRRCPQGIRRRTFEDFCSKLLQAGAFSPTSVVAPNQQCQLSRNVEGVKRPELYLPSPNFVHMMNDLQVLWCTMILSLKGQWSRSQDWKVGGHWQWCLYNWNWNYWN